MAGEVQLFKQDGVATLTLCNEARYNAMSIGMWRSLAELLARLHDDAEVRAVVLRGQGERAFVSGADISEFETQRSSADGVAAYDRAVDAAQTALARFRAPVVAAISGICYGGGLGLSLACDLRYAAPRSKFRMPAARLGLGYARGGMQRMVDVLGPANAAEMFYTARIYDAQQATQLGLVHSVHDDVFAQADATARQIAANAPLTVAAAKRAIASVLSGQDDGSVADAVRACFESQDYAEGRLAFKEKREPRFQGR